MFYSSVKNTRKRVKKDLPILSTVPKVSEDGGQCKGKRRYSFGHGYKTIPSLHLPSHLPRNLIRWCNFWRYHLTTGALIFLIYVLGTKTYSRISLRVRSKRRLIGNSEIPVKLSSIAQNKQHLFSFPVKPDLEILGKTFEPHYGGLKINTRTGNEKTRTIKIDPNDEMGHVYSRHDFRGGKDDRVNSYYAFDDDQVRHKKCRRVSWHKMYHPSCNNAHEFLLPEADYFSHGYYRDVWSSGNLNEKDTVVIKTMRMKHDYDYESLEFVRNDALTMERLSSSPRIVDIFVHCGSTVITESLAEEMEEQIVPGSGMLRNYKKHNVTRAISLNTYTPAQKLTIALEMAESIADLHGFKDGVIVHDDIQICQWLRTADGQLKLNDFNRAEVMLFDQKNKNYCKYQNGKVYGNYRSPEEMSNSDLDEKIDVYSFGNNIYGLLTGLWIFYENEDDQVVQEKTIAGNRGFIDERYRTRSYAEAELVKVMELCWEQKPEKRADIFLAVKMLRAAVEKNNVLEKK